MSTVRIQIRRGISTDWESIDPVLADGELGIESDTNKVKVGHNGAVWTSLPYLNVVPTDLGNTLNDYVLVSDVGNAGGPAKLDVDGNLLIPKSSIILEGSAANDYETTLTVTNPTADRTITFPDASGTVALTSDIGELSQDAIDSALTAGTGIVKEYNDGSNTLTLSVDTGVIATTEALRSVVASLNIHSSAMVATTAHLAATYTAGTADNANGYGVGAKLTMSANGALEIDGYALAQDDRVLVKNQTNSIHNGIYRVSVVGGPSTPAELIRAEDYNNSDYAIPADVTKGDVIFINTGDTNALKQFSQINAGTNTDESVKIGVEPIDFTQISGTATIVAGDGILKNLDTVSLDTAFTDNIYLKQSDATATYLTQADAGTDYLSKTEASNDYLTKNSASSTYLTQTNAGTTYLSKTDAGNTYLAKTDAESDYLKKSTTAISNTNIATDAGILATKISGTAVTQADSATVTNTMLAGSIANNKLENSTISGKSLGSNLDTLTIGTGLSGTSYNGSSAVTIAIDSTVATKTYADTAVSNHESDSTNVHGITDTANLVYTNDSRLSDTRTPTDNSVTNAKLADDAVDTAEIKDGAVTSAKIANGTIVDADINASAEISQSKISGLTSDLSAKLDKSGGTMTGALTLSGAPSADLHAATKAYVDGVASNINFHQPVAVASTSNVALTGNSNPLVIDTYTVQDQDRVLLKDQTDQKQNGIYVYTSSTGAFARAADADNTPAGELAGGDFTLVLNGGQSGYGYVCSNTSAITIGSTNITYAPFNAAKAVVAGNGLTEPTPGTLAVDTSIIQARVSGVSDTEIGYLDGVTSAIQTQLNAKAPTASPTFTGTVTLSASGIAFTDGTQTKEGVPSRTPIISKTGNYTLSALTERDSLIEVDSTSPVTITIPTNSSVAFPIGTTLDILGVNTGLITIAGDTGVTVNATPGLKLRTQWSSCTLFKRATDSWVVYGDLKA